MEYYYPLTSSTFLSLKEELHSLSFQTYDFLEWRLDYMKTKDEIKKSLSLFKTCSFSVLLTLRSLKEGGARHYSLKEEQDIYRMLISSGLFHFIDLEIEHPYFKSYYKQFFSADFSIVLSYHNQEKTPDLKRLKQIKETMLSYRPFWVKFACFIQTKEDLLSLKALGEYKQYPFQLIIGMGEKGWITRLVPELFYSRGSFVSGKNASAKGQWEKKDIVKLRKF